MESLKYKYLKTLNVHMSPIISGANCMMTKPAVELSLFAVKITMLTLLDKRNGVNGSFIFCPEWSRVPGIQDSL